MEERPKTLEEIQAEIEQELNQPVKLNRAQRRALKHKGGKSGQTSLGAINETARKLNYISLIEKLRELNKNKEKEENNDATKDN